MKSPALFLDRDGVINIDIGYVHKIEEFSFIDGIFDLVAAAKKAGYLVIIVTNQAGIGRGYYSEEDFHALMHWVCTQFNALGGMIDAVYFSPYHPEHGLGQYRRDSNCRKPRPGMLLQAENEQNIDMASSIMVGDKASDIEAGRAAGISKLFKLGEKTMGCQSIPIQGPRDVIPFLT